MDIEQKLLDRCNSKCELCSSSENLSVYDVPFTGDYSIEGQIIICDTCNKQDMNDVNHWRCLNDSMWSPIPAVQVIAWRILNRLSSEAWARDLLDMLYLEDNVLECAKAEVSEEDDDEVVCVDSNGTRLNAGDSVTLIKDLVVKGAGFTAKRGTMVKNISLTSNPEHIEGRVNGTQIVLLTCYLKKST